MLTNLAAKFREKSNLKRRLKTLSTDKKRLLENFISLSVLQGVNYILPLITFPYLVRVLGVEKFGLLAFATATVTYFQILTDYGFNLSATREISIHRENKEKVQEIFSSVMIIKFGLLILSFVLLIILILSFDKFRKDWEVFILSFGMVVGQVFFPIWFFQGMERMKYITYINIGSRLLFTIAIFIFVQEKSDFYMVPILSSLGTIFGGLYALYFIRTNFEIKFAFQKIEILKNYLLDGWHLFVSSFGVSLYKSNTILILGIFTTDLIVGYFAIAKKIIDATNQIASVISRTLFPHVVKKYNLDKKFIQFLFKLGGGILLYTFFIFILLFFFTEYISLFISGEIHKELIESLSIMQLVPLVIAINIPAVHILLVGKKDRYFSRSVLIGGIADLVLLFAIIPSYDYIGASLVVLFTEIFVTTMLYYYAIKLIKGKL